MSVAMAAATSGAAIAALTSINKIPLTPSGHHHRPTSRIPYYTHFTPKTKPSKPLDLKPLRYYPHTPAVSLLLPRASDSFDQTAETEEEEEVVEEDGGNYVDDDQSETESSELGRLYVGNLPYAMTNSQLSEVFQEAGRVVSVEIVYDRLTDRSRGFAFVTMGSIEAAKEAIRMFDGSQVGGRTVKVNFPEVPRGGEREVLRSKIRDSYQGFVDSPHKIYAGNLSWGLTSQGLREAFFNQPGLLSAKVIYDRASGRSRGFGFITFSSTEAVESALSAMNGVEVEGRPLRLNKADERALNTPPPPPLSDNFESGFQSNGILSGVGD